MSRACDGWRPVTTWGHRPDAAGNGRPIVTAILVENEQTDVGDTGAYLRVLVPDVCRVSRVRSSATRTAGLLPGDLELVMPSFSGLVWMTERGAAWWRSSRPQPEVPS
jgi:hypothetical protein